MGHALIQQIRSSISSGQFENAQKLWEGYAGHLAAELRAGPVPASRVAEMQSLAEWCRLATLAARAHTQDQLNSLAASRKYSSQPPTGPSRIVASF